MPPAVDFRHVSKSYPIYSTPGDRLKELLFLNRARFHRDFWALRELTFDIERGETFCIVGENGSGKSTLLQIIGGILQPTAGETRISGRVAALLELGSGFNPEFSGRDNVYLNGAILGFSRKEMDAKFPAIEQFAEIGPFINEPVKTYSSGMAVRLAFAVAIHVDPDILLIDEALAVGDLYFRQRCMRQVHELRSRGVTIVFVSHSIGEVRAIGDRTLWLENGRLRELGDTDAVTTHYLAAMAEKDSRYIGADASGRRAKGVLPESVAPAVVTAIPRIDHRHGDGRAEVIGIAILDQGGSPVGVLEPGRTITVRISARANQELLRPVLGFMLRNHAGLDFAGTDTARENLDLPPIGLGDVLTVDFHLDLPDLYPSSFSFSPSIADETLAGPVICDWIDNAITLQMIAGGGQVYGYIHLPCRVEVNRTLGALQPREALYHAESRVG